MRSICTVFIIAAAAAMPAMAAPRDTIVVHEAQGTLNGLVSPNGPGATILIARGDRVIYRGTRGRANIELGVPLASGDTFRIASVTKMFTAAMIVKLSEQGKLSLDDPLSRFLPDFPNAQAITLRELLSHRSGISDIVHDIESGFSKREVSTATLLAEIVKRPPDFAPGQGWAYSNSGFIVLGAVIEKVTGQSWYGAIDTQFLQPLRLSHTGYGASAPLVSGRAAGYSTNGHTHVVTNAGYISSSIPAAAGGLISTADDLMRWMRALSHGKVVSASDFQAMIEPAPRLPGSHSSYDYGLGTYIWRVRGAEMIGHTGQIDGFTSAAVYLPAQDITIVVLANDDNFDANGTGRRMAAIALGHPYTEGPPVKLSAGEMAALAGTYGADPRTLRHLTVKDGQLLMQRASGNILPLRMTKGNELHFVPDEISYFVPVRDGDGRVTALNYFEAGEAPPLTLSRQP